ncbi:hypothetical protein HNY73_004575 [Argiope bruennichi]|uniref:Uncharacterized protein n=1 Tax=Argiope bruennichi TaxID=94029 RepID=A0A8T0FQF3_ARGBR|nr:hypothetical protein HNY73_004575 [Argiope bruennichi]
MSARTVESCRCLVAWVMSARTVESCRCLVAWVMMGELWNRVVVWCVGNEWENCGIVSLFGGVGNEWENCGIVSLFGGVGNEWENCGIVSLLVAWVMSARTVNRVVVWWRGNNDTSLNLSLWNDCCFGLSQILSTCNWTIRKLSQNAIEDNVCIG